MPDSRFYDLEIQRKKVEGSKRETVEVNNLKEDKSQDDIERDMAKKAKQLREEDPSHKYRLRYVNNIYTDQRLERDDIA